MHTHIHARGSALQKHSSLFDDDEDSLPGLINPYLEEQKPAGNSDTDDDLPEPQVTPKPLLPPPMDGIPGGKRNDKGQAPLAPATQGIAGHSHLGDEGKRTHVQRRLNVGREGGGGPKTRFLFIPFWQRCAGNERLMEVFLLFPPTLGHRNCNVQSMLP